MNIILFVDPSTRQQLLPFTFTRPLSEIRAGILTIREKWERRLPANYSWLTEKYLSEKYRQHSESHSIYLLGSVFPEPTLIEALKTLKPGQVIVEDTQVIALAGRVSSLEELEIIASSPSVKRVNLNENQRILRKPYEIFADNGKNIRDDFELITIGRKSQPVTDKFTAVYGAEQIFIEENVSIKACVLNAENGPIYIGANCEIGETSVIRGNNAICENSTLGNGTQIRGDATIGPYCKVGGEISNSVIFGYSSKAHVGFLGNSVIGEWCNLGAGTNTSNLKNNYRNVKIWNYITEQYEDTGRQFCGLMMGDHSKCGIDTMFNTGTMVGVSANIFGAGYNPTFIPSFSWGGPQGMTTYKLKDALDVMPRVLERRGKLLTEADVAIYTHIFERTKKYRSETRI